MSRQVGRQSAPLWAALIGVLLAGCQDRADGVPQVVIGDISVSPPVVRAGQSAVFSVSVANPGGKKLEFVWSCTHGTISQAGSPAVAKYIAPAEPASVRIQLAVKADGALIANKQLTLIVERGGIVDVMSEFILSGWMGDCTSGPPVCTVDDGWRTNPHSAPICLRITYRPQRSGWAGMYFLYGDQNWGDQPGRNFHGYRRLTFWARADQEALVEFKAGGIRADGKPHRDSFERSLGTQQVGSEWRQYRIDLTGTDLSSVIGGFAWVAKAVSNPTGLTLYLDDILYEE
jgi:hypothetical protein